MKHSRRTFLKVSTSSLLLGGATTLTAQTVPTRLEALLRQGVLDEVQAGDPELMEKEETRELLSFSAGQLQKATPPATPALEPKNAEKVALRMLAISLEYAKEKVGRFSVPPDQVREILKLFGFGLKYEDSEVYVPFCAAGVSYAACRAFCDVEPGKIQYQQGIGFYPTRLETFRARLREIRAYHFFPSAAVRLIAADAQDKNRWAELSADPKPGWLVVFRWKGEIPNHIGIVEKAEKNALQTVEYNTILPGGTGSERDGGLIARRSRDRNKTVFGFVKMY